MLIKKYYCTSGKKINNLGIPGVEFVPVIKRFYPHREITSHFVGHVNGNMLDN